MYSRNRPTPLRSNALFRERYEAELQAAELDEAADYVEWLRAKGVEPTSGKMTADGLKFFGSLLEERNAANRLKRQAPRPSVG